MKKPPVIHQAVHRVLGHLIPRLYTDKLIWIELAHL